MTYDIEGEAQTGVFSKIRYILLVFRFRVVCILFALITPIVTYFLYLYGWVWVSSGFWLFSFQMIRMAFWENDQAENEV